MTPYEHLEQLCVQHGIIIDTQCLTAEDPADGIYVGYKDLGHVICINRHRSLRQRTAALAEELGHYFRSNGDIAAQDSWQARRQELLGRAWSYERLLPKEQLLDEYVRNGHTQPWQLAEQADLPEGFIREAIDYYNRKQPVGVHGPAAQEVAELIRAAIEKRREPAQEPPAAPPEPEPIPQAAQPARPRRTPPKPKRRVDRKAVRKQWKKLPVMTRAEAVAFINRDLPPHLHPFIEHIFAVDSNDYWYFRLRALLLYGLTANDPRWHELFNRWLLGGKPARNPTNMEKRVKITPNDPTHRALINLIFNVWE